MYNRTKYYRMYQVLGYKNRKSVLFALEIWMSAWILNVSHCALLALLSWERDNYILDWTTRPQRGERALGQAAWAQKQRTFIGHRLAHGAWWSLAVRILRLNQQQMQQILNIQWRVSWGDKMSIFYRSEVNLSRVVPEYNLALPPSPHGALTVWPNY